MLRESIYYLVAQISGAIAGVGLANLMFDLPVFFVSTKIRAGSSQFLSEFIATFGLIAVINSVGKFRPQMVFLAVAALHHSGILVHGFDIFCKSGGNDCAVAFKHICGN